jgi:hypothetical protein
MAKEVEAGDAFTITAGCDKHFKTCKAKFDNTGGFAKGYRTQILGPSRRFRPSRYGPSAIRRLPTSSPNCR